jgi:hypothetical protein
MHKLLEGKKFLYVKAGGVYNYRRALKGCIYLPIKQYEEHFLKY